MRNQRDSSHRELNKNSGAEEFNDWNEKCNRGLQGQNWTNKRWNQWAREENFEVTQWRKKEKNEKEWRKPV